MFQHMYVTLDLTQELGYLWLFNVAVNHPHGSQPPEMHCFSSVFYWRLQVPNTGKKSTGNLHILPRVIRSLLTNSSPSAVRLDGYVAMEITLLCFGCGAKIIRRTRGVPQPWLDSQFFFVSLWNLRTLIVLQLHYWVSKFCNNIWSKGM